MSDGPAAGPLNALTVPPEVQQEILERAGSSLEGLVSPEHQVEAAQRVLKAIGAGISVRQTEVLATQHSGPLPSPQTVAGYEQVVPGSADRLIKMAERDQGAYISSSKRGQWLDFSYNVIALLGGLAGLGAILGSAIYLAERGHENVAIAFVGLGVSGVIGAFVNARMKKAD